ncbi:hypothetical protein [Flavobacterium succinicans]|uniref:Uncharacterized protein n=1 Tax=Flavobacterium succinicans TaxID=29536 RepID=A0A199XR04_9FLAO|nr:hypothetical protein [Flavobacterium succinicans]OAZ03676.1 hypothetical protein FLB_19540 [Flavobacterium succinicans]
MLNKINELLPTHNIITENSPELYVVDYTNINGGNVVLLNSKPIEGNVYIQNVNRVPIYFDGFDNNALEISTGIYSRQCECIIFPQQNTQTDWILAIETKYVNNLENAFKENFDYPNCMIDQIIQTVNYFRNKGIIDINRRVNAIVSFPTLIEDFSSTFFTGDLSIEDILINYKIRIRATNTAEIISNKRINI